MSQNPSPIPLFLAGHPRVAPSTFHLGVEGKEEGELASSHSPRSFLSSLSLVHTYIGFTNCKLQMAFGKTRCTDSSLLDKSPVGTLGLHPELLLFAP